jgi:hypothetical protein
MLGIDIDLYALDRSGGLAVIDITEEVLEILVDVSFFIVPLAKFIRFVPDHDIPNLASPELGAPAGKFLGSLAIPKIAQNRCIYFFGPPCGGKGDVNLEGLVIRS